MRLVRFNLFLVLAAAALLSAGCYSDTITAGDPAAKVLTPSLCLTTDDADRLSDQVLQLINLERSAADLNLSPVTASPKLRAIAENYACRMIEEAFFDHTDPITGRGPGDRAVAGKYRFYAIGENLAAGPETAAEAVKAWMESPSHRAIILDPRWTQVGIGLRSGGDYGIYWVQLFGVPASDL